MMKSKKTDKKLLHLICKSFTLLNKNDRKTVINRKIALEAMPSIRKLIPRIINSFPKAYSKHARAGVRTYKDALGVLREALRFGDRRLASNREYLWVKDLKKQVYYYTYRIA
jgi:hypothetical protein